MTTSIIKCPRITKYRKELLESCRSYIDSIVEPEHAESGSAQTENQNIETQSGGIVQVANITADLKEHYHGRVIQEWYLFIKQIFREASLFYLKTGYLTKAPSINFKIKLSHLRATRKITELRENICSEIEDSFSFLSYEQRFDIIKKFFDTNHIHSNLIWEMKKHVQIRNILEHSRNGIIRDSDLENIGRLSKYLEVLLEDNTSAKLRVGEKVVLYKPELENLYKVIKDISQNLYTLKI